MNNIDAQIGPIYVSYPSNDIIDNLLKSYTNTKPDYDFESFDKSIDNKVKYDKKFINKTKLECKNCGAHLGNVWNDGPETTGNRHCVTKNALIFKTLKIN